MIFSLGTLGRTVLSLFSDREMFFAGGSDGLHLVKVFEADCWLRSQKNTVRRYSVACRLRSFMLKPLARVTSTKPFSISPLIAQAAASLDHPPACASSRADR